METWTPKVEDDSWYLKHEDGNKPDKCAVAVINGGQVGRFIKKNSVKLSRSSYSSIKCVINCIVVGKCINWRLRYDLEIQVK